MSIHRTAAEAELERARQHVREAEARLQRLEALATKGHYEAADLITRVISTMQRSVELAGEHVARLESKAAKRRA